MEKSSLFLTLIVIICFGVWPIFGTLSGFPKAWIIIFIGLAILLSGLVALYTLPEQSLSFRNTEIPTDSAIKFLTIAVLLNCVGNFFFSNILASKSEYIPYYVMMVMAGVPISAQISQLYAGKAVLTNWTVPGIVMVVVGIFLLTLKKM